MFTAGHQLAPWSHVPALLCSHDLMGLNVLGQVAQEPQDCHARSFLSAGPITGEDSRLQRVGRPTLPCWQVTQPLSGIPQPRDLLLTLSKKSLLVFTKGGRDSVKPTAEGGGDTGLFF